MIEVLRLDSINSVSLLLLIVLRQVYIKRAIIEQKDMKTMSSDGIINMFKVANKAGAEKAVILKIPASMRQTTGSVLEQWQEPPLQGLQLVKMLSHLEGEGLNRENYQTWALLEKDSLHVCFPRFIHKGTKK